MKNLLKNDWLIWIILLAPFAVIAFYWNQFPEQIPMRWDFNGEVSEYSSKVFGLLFPPLLNIGLYGLFKAMPYIDPKKYNYPLFKTKFNIIRLVLHIFISALSIVTSYYSLGYDINIVLLINVGVVVLMLIIGNYLSAVRPNYFVGIRTPWTLANETVWTKTHRFTGRLWVAASLLMLVFYMLLPFNPAFLFVYIAVLAVPPFIYSYLLFRKHEKNNTNHFML